MRSLFADNLKGGIISGVLATLCIVLMFSNPFWAVSSGLSGTSLYIIFPAGLIIGIVGLRKSWLAIREGKLLGILGILLSLPPFVLLMFFSLLVYNLFNSEPWY